MLQGIQALLDLSRVDVTITELEEELAGLPAAREALAAERARTAEAVEAAKTALGEAEQEQRRYEAAAADREAQVAKLEGQQHQVKTNEAYTALLHEIDAARAGISDAETNILEAMERIEAAREGLERARVGAQSVDQRVAGQERVLAEREQAIAQTLGNLRRERDGLSDGVDAVLLQRYARIASRRRPAVAVVQRETCMGCRVGLPPQQVIDLHKGETLITCGNCLRILVLEDRS